MKYKHLVPAIVLGWFLLSPITIEASSAYTFAQVSAGGWHTCGMRTDGSLACWGEDTYGQATPPAGTFSQVTAGYEHTCGVRTDGTLACWGDNTYGQATPPAGTFGQVSAGDYHTCGVRTDGTLACWGRNNYGQAAPPAGTFSEISAGDQHTCAVKTGGILACWGYNLYGQATPPAGTFSHVDAGLYCSCGVKTDGTLACWGNDGYGKTTPPAGTFTQVTAGGQHSCGVKTDGTLACWGLNYNGQATPPAGTFSQVSAGDYHTCAVRSDGSLACWGENYWGQATPPTAPPAWRFPWEYGTKWYYTGGPHHWSGSTLSGLDFASGPNRHVYALADGTVNFVAQENCVGGLCNTVKIGHQGGWETWYVHLASFAPGLQQGQTVRQGQYLGEEGDSGANGVTHLHLELRKDGAPASWDGQVIDGWTVHVNCGTGAPAGCTPGEWNGYMEKGTEKIIPLASAGDGQLVGPSTNPSAAQVLGTSVNVPAGTLVDHAATVPPAQTRVYFLVSWPGSTVDTSLAAPDGTPIGPSTTDPDVFHNKGDTFEYYEILTPLAGTWTVHLYGADVPPEGEDADILVAGDSTSAVGGIADLPDAYADAAATKSSQSAPNTFAVAGFAASGALLLVAGAWYSRRRWPGRR
jgi:murein DD-endopeptidase MepM/ murein hydrolase activator NlpD